MPQLTVTVSVLIDGTSVAGFPLTRSLAVDEIQTFGPVERDGDGNSSTFGTLPVDSINVLQALVFQNDIACNVRLNGQSTAFVAMNPGGVLVLLNANLASGNPATNATLNNPGSASTFVSVRGVGGGT